MMQKMNWSSRSFLTVLLISYCSMIFPSDAFQFPSSTISTAKQQYKYTTTYRTHSSLTHTRSSPSSSSSSSVLHVYNDDEEKEQIEEARVNIYQSRRGEIRTMLKSAESLRNFRYEKGFVPELDEDGNPVKDEASAKTAVTATAFAVTAGAIILRVGGRAALVSAVGLDFIQDNPDMQNQINQVLEYTETMDPLLKSGLFIFGWTLTKTFCFDAAGIVLAFSSGILFGGVLQGAVMSALGATIGSSVAFALVRIRKALI